MPKLERLIKLARLKRDGKKLTVRELSRACGVSQRTLYRYLNTLVEVDMPEDLQRRPHRERWDTTSALMQPDDRSLLLYALEYNALVRYPYFARRFRKIRQLVTAARGEPSQIELSSLYEFILVRKPSAGPVSNSFLERFSKACTSSKAVRLRVRGQGRRAMVLWPKAIRIKGKDILLLMIDPDHGRSVEVALSRINQLEICRTGSSNAVRMAMASRRPGRKKG